MEQELYLVDSFTSEPFKGNPAGVCLNDQSLSEDLMLSIAQELGLSETAFLTPTSNEDTFTIRFFSPKVEIPLCGHATLAAAKVLFKKLPYLKRLHFITIQKIDLIINATLEGISMKFPRYDTYPATAPPQLLSALGLNTVTNAAYNQETNILLLEISDARELRRLSPNYDALIRSHDNINGVLVTAQSKDENYDFESRYFWPWSGTNEDPATGGTHTFLTPYWHKRLKKNKMKSFQCSKRTGQMSVELLADDKILIHCDARIIFSGTIQV